jgi:hypothetical protein
MSDQQSRTASDDLYDHELEEPRSGRRRRPVADWGVGDDMFEHMPRNRFSHTAEGPSRDRRFSRAAESDRRFVGPGRDTGEDEERTEDPAPRAEAPRAAGPDPSVPRGRVEDGRRTIVIGKPEDVPSEIAAITADRDIEVEEEAPPAPKSERRTVRIGGHPEGSLEAARFHRDHSRRRPPRTAQERVGARPDRIVMWAFALGLLLILIAILSQ